MNSYRATESTGLTVLAERAGFYDTIRTLIKSTLCRCPSGDMESLQGGFWIPMTNPVPDYRGVYPLGDQPA